MDRSMSFMKNRIGEKNRLVRERERIEKEERDR